MMNPLENANLTPEEQNPEELKGDGSNVFLQAMDAAVKLTTATAELQNKATAAREQHRDRVIEQRIEFLEAHGISADRFRRISLGRSDHEPSLVAKVKEGKRKREKKKKEKRASRHSSKRVIFFRYSYYDVAFKYLIEQCMDANYVKLPPRTKRTIELGSRYSTDYVCTPFKHILGDYIEALEAGADVIVTMAGPCRLGYYGEVHASILHDLGYQFEVLNFSELRGAKEHIKAFQKINPRMDVPRAIRNLLTLVKMVQNLDEAWDFYLANAGFEVQPGSFDAAFAAYHDSMDSVTDDASLAAAHNAGMAALRALPVNKPSNPIRVGIVGELYTAVDQDSCLNTERKLLNLGVELHKRINLTNRYLNYNEVNLRASAADYLRYDMGPTSTLTVSAAKQFAEQGFDGLVHIKSAGCTPEIDCVPVLQEIARDYHVPTIYLTFDSQTSDAGLDTRLEAFYDMLAMKKGANAR